jgi:hypothetical protein
MAAFAAMAYVNACEFLILLNAHFYRRIGCRGRGVISWRTFFERVRHAILLMPLLPARANKI